VFCKIKCECSPPVLVPLCLLLLFIKHNFFASLLVSLLDGIYFLVDFYLSLNWILEVLFFGFFKLWLKIIKVFQASYKNKIDKELRMFSCLAFSATQWVMYPSKCQQLSLPLRNEVILNFCWRWCKVLSENFSNFFSRCQWVLTTLLRFCLYFLSCSSTYQTMPLPSWFLISLSIFCFISSYAFNFSKCTSSMFSNFVSFSCWISWNLLNFSPRCASSFLMRWIVDSKNYSGYLPIFFFLFSSTFLNFSSSLATFWRASSSWFMRICDRLSLAFWVPHLASLLFGA